MLPKQNHLPDSLEGKKDRALPVYWKPALYMYLYKLDNRDSQRTVLSTTTAKLINLVEYKGNIPVRARSTDVDNCTIS